MRLLLRLATLLLALAAAPAGAGEVRDVAPVQVAPRTWVIHGPLGDPSPENQGFMNNPGFVVTNDGVVVIDPGSSLPAGRMVLRQIRKVTDKPVTHVLNTHVHGDHWLGNQAIRDAYPLAQIMAHPAMIKAARGGEGARWLDIMSRLTQGFTRETKAVYPNVSVAEQSFAAGGVGFRILAPERAHSGTDIMIEVVEDGVLFLGDNVMNGRFGRLDEGSFRGGIAACDRALALPTKVFVPGHGKTGGREIVDAYRRYLAAVIETVAREYDAGRQDYEMKDTVRARVAGYTRWEGFDLHFGRHISVAVLEIEAM
jgi:glyoxylase-like metal-dependent hydrolase (beta-lactamase superfamily II)